MKIKKNDNVIVITGKDKGKQGKVVESFPRIGKVVVEGVNIKRKTQKSKKAGSKGQIINKSMPIDVSNVMMIDQKTKKRSRLGYKIEKGLKTRIARKSGVSM